MYLQYAGEILEYSPAYFKSNFAKISSILENFGQIC